MAYNIDSVNTILRPAIKNRIGTQDNIYGAKSIAQQQWGLTSLNAGQLSYSLVLEATYWLSYNSLDVDIPLDCINDSVVNNLWSICNQANNSHNKGASTAAGAAIGLNFGLIGAAIGGIFGWAFSQNAANNDIQKIVMYALQATDYLCDVIIYRMKQENYFEIEQKQRETANNKAKEQNQKKSFPKFVDVIGLEEAKQAITDRIIEPAKHPDIYKKYGYKAGGGILLYGLPGTGKTMFAQAVANEIDGKFFSIKASDLKSKWYGESEGKIKDLFDEARKEKISVIFIDEFEAIGIDRNKDTNDLTGSTLVPELLAQMQGFEQDENNILLVIAATNRPWDIDSALIRPGRLDYKVYVELPNKECRAAMLKNYLNKVQYFDVAFNYLVEHTEGYNGADIKNVADSLIKIVINKEITGVQNYHLDYDDAVDILNRIHSSVSNNDVYLMELFRKQK